MEEIAAFCKKWQIREFALFGSVLRDDFRPDSDIDVMVTFEEDSHITLLGLARAQRELAELLGHPVDLIDRAGVEQSRNQRRRKHMLESARVVYAA